MKKKYDVTKVSRETLEAFAQVLLNADLTNHMQYVAYYTTNHPGFTGHGPITNLFNEATVSVRTRAEVDSDIIKCLRTYAKEHASLKGRLQFDGTYFGGTLRDVRSDLNLLLEEETSD